MAHKIRAPIARILGLSAIMKKEDREEHAHENLTRLLNTTRELDHVVSELGMVLDSQIAVAGHYEEVCLTKVVEKVKVLFRKEIAENEVQILTDFTAADSIYSLPQYIESIFINLISNSIKYRHARRRPVIKIRTSIGENYQIEFTDNGIGMDLNQNKDDLFELYKRFHYHVKGRGLGLFLIKSQVESLQGKLLIESEVGQGTTFIIHLRILHQEIRPVNL